MAVKTAEQTDAPHLPLLYFIFVLAGGRVSFHQREEVNEISIMVELLWYIGLLVEKSLKK